MESIAVVNNEKNIGVLVQFHLERPGYRVRVYGRGVVLLRELRKHTAVPVIFLSPHAEDIAEELRGELEAADYIASPFSMVDVVARVKKVLERRNDTV